MRPITLALLTVLPLAGQNANLTCDATAEPNLVRQEGVSEVMGAIVLRCAALAAGTVRVSSGFILYVSTPVTNRITNDEKIDVTMTAETSTGTQFIGGTPLLINNNAIVFQVFDFNLPPSGQTVFRIANIRASGSTGGRTISATISTNGQTSIGIRNNPVTIGVPQRGLLAASANGRVICRGAPTPDEPNFGNLLNVGSNFTFRVTENHPAVFEPRTAGTTNGQRILIKYSGFPDGARLFVPKLVAGSTSGLPTSTGEFGITANSGGYIIGSSGLLLALAENADPDGAGGNVVLQNGGPAVEFGAVSEIRLSGGAGTAAWEIVDANSGVIEFALIPTFITLPLTSPAVGTIAAAQVSFGPLSRGAFAAPGAAVPRYVDQTAPSDCRVLNDCNANYFPKLTIEAPDLLFTWTQGTPTLQTHRINVRNEGGGAMPWLTRIDYQNQSTRSWLTVFPPIGLNNQSITLGFNPAGLAPGTYRAILVIDAAGAGSRNYPVSLVVVAPAPGGPEPNPNPNPQPPPNVNPDRPVYWTVGNAANLSLPTLAPGSLGAVEGVRLDAARVALDGVEAQVVANTGRRVTFVVPTQLAGRTSAELRISTASGQGDPVRVPLQFTAPAIFEGGVINSNGQPNTRTSPELAGGVLQIFATGLPADARSILVRLHDIEITQPLYAGPTPGQPGTQQMNIAVPEEFPAIPTEVMVCGLLSPTERVCSVPAPVWITR